MYNTYNSIRCTMYYMSTPRGPGGGAGEGAGEAGHAMHSAPIP